jgi:low affinity Fe/Cu permease
MKVRHIIANILVILTSLMSYYFAKFSQKHPSFLIFIIPVCVTLIASALYSLDRKDDPKYPIYYLFHFSKTSRIIVAIGITLMIITIIYYHFFY